ncbi:MAG TPA: hypothetical protein VEP30_02130 [Chthoniobacterales bacterium]|nr:hypothetical protein [Chthoniobacterales bacterium]
MKPPSENSGGAHDVDPSTPLRTSLDRLLRAASKAKDEAPVEMPFGFDARVVALSRRNGNGAVFGAFMRRVALIAAGIIVLATAGAYLEFKRNGDAITASGNEFAIADSAIQDEVGR